MAKNQELYDKIREILIKKAEGYFYNEECFEYSIKQKTADEQISFDDIIEKKSKQKNNKNQEQPLNLVKKKVTTHYIPPDMLAIKILLENFGEKINSELESMSEEELISYKNKLIKNINELIKENKNDNWKMRKKHSLPQGRVQ